jgi:peptidoglycan/LPS O-acetylase OafA/YrhL
MNFYRPELDGIRAVAILAVLAFHVEATWMPGGFLGVDVFFVLSGYLISRKIVPEIFREPHEARFSLKQFCFRRIKRLVPAILVMIATLQCIGFFILLKSEWTDLSTQSLAAILAIENMYLWWNMGDYWGPEAETMPLLHTWSLGIEEQFYIAYPIFLLVTQKASTSRTIRLCTMAAIATVSFLGFVYARRNYPDAGFYWAPLRAWELLAGCLIAEHDQIQKHRQTLYPRIRSILAVTGLSVILYGCISGWGRHVITWRSAGLTVVATALVILCTSRATCPTGRLLSLKPLVGLGRLSYSVYLWHWPIIVLSAYFGISSAWHVVPLIILISWASYLLVECPARHCSNKKFVLLFTGLLAATVASLMLPILSWRPLKYFPAPAFHHEISLHPSNPSPRFDEFAGTLHGGLSLFNADNFTADVVVFGDSHAVMYFPAIRQACEQLSLSLTFFGAAYATSPFFVEDRSKGERYGLNWDMQQRVAFDQARIQFLEKHRPRFVFVCARWSQYAPIYHLWSEDSFNSHLQKLTDACGSSTVVFVGQPPELPIAGNGFSDGQLEEPLFRVYRERALLTRARRLMHGQIKLFCTNHPDCHFLETEDIFSRDNRTTFIDDTGCLYFDDDHLSLAGARRATPKFTALLSGLLNSMPM